MSTEQVTIKCLNCLGITGGKVEEILRLEPEITHDKWDEFVNRLEGPEGCDFPDFASLTEDQNAKIKSGEPVWKCAGDHRFTRRILADIGVPEGAIRKMLNYCTKQRCDCDCEILINIAWR